MVAIARWNMLTTCLCVCLPTSLPLRVSMNAFPFRIPLISFLLVSLSHVSVTASMSTRSLPVSPSREGSVLLARSLFDTTVVWTRLLTRLQTGPLDVDETPSPIALSLVSDTHFD